MARRDGFLVAPAGGRLVAGRLEVPVLAKLLAAAIGGEAKEQAAGDRDLLALGAHGRPPLDRNPLTRDDRLPEADPDVRLGRRRLRPVRADPLRAQVGSRNGCARYTASPVKSAAA